MSSANDPKARAAAGELADAARVPEPTAPAPPHEQLSIDDSNRYPPTKATIRALASAYQRAEVEAVLLNERWKEQKEECARLGVESQHATTRASRSLSVLNLALRAVALRRPMPTEAQADAAESLHASDVIPPDVLELPAGVKAGDVIQSKHTGDRFEVVESNGCLFAFPMPPAGR